MADTNHTIPEALGILRSQLLLKDLKIAQLEADVTILRELVMGLSDNLTEARQQSASGEASADRVMTTLFATQYRLN